MNLPSENLSFLRCSVVNWASLPSTSSRPLPPWPQCHYLITNPLPVGCLLCIGSSVHDHVDTKPIEISLHSLLL